MINDTALNNKCVAQTVDTKVATLCGRVKIANIFPQAVHSKEYIRDYIETYEPKDNVDLFRLIPDIWLQNPCIKENLIRYTKSLSEPHLLLLNAILWDYDRIKRFCTLPSSMSGHHYEINGNLAHTIEVVENMQNLCIGLTSVNVSLGILMAFLHDIGKADEYELTTSGGWKMSERGILIGHKAIAYEWVVEAVNKWNVELPSDHYHALLHSLSAVAYAPDWMGLRKPVMQECMLLSIADRLSVNNNLMLQTINPKGGFGRHHMHLGHAPFSVRG
jgi:3'-5' exoribonuclease